MVNAVYSPFAGWQARGVADGQASRSSDKTDIHTRDTRQQQKYMTSQSNSHTNDETGHLLDAPCLLGHLVQGRPPARVSPHLPSFSQSFAEESSEGDHSTLKWRANGPGKEGSTNGRKPCQAKA